MDKTLLCVQDFADELDKLFRKPGTQLFGMDVIVVSDAIMKHVKDRKGNSVRWMLVDKSKFAPVAFRPLKADC